jgi:hypothetical protein
LITCVLQAVVAVVAVAQQIIMAQVAAGPVDIGLVLHKQSVLERL